MTFLSKEISWLFHTLSSFPSKLFVIAFLPRSRHHLISWLQSLPIVVFTAAVTVHRNTVTSRLAFLIHLPFVLWIPMLCLPTLDSWLQPSFQYRMQPAGKLGLAISSLVLTPLHAGQPESLILPQVIVRFYFQPHPSPCPRGESPVFPSTTNKIYMPLKKSMSVVFIFQTF